MGEFNALYLANIIFENHLKILKLITWKITVPNERVRNLLGL